MIYGNLGLYETVQRSIPVYRADTPDLGTETSRHGVNTEIVNIFMFTYKTFT